MKKRLLCVAIVAAFALPAAALEGTNIGDRVVATATTTLVAAADTKAKPAAPAVAKAKAAKEAKKAKKAKKAAAKKVKAVKKVKKTKAGPGTKA